MISLIVTLEVNPDKLEQFIEFIKEEARDARELESGCLRFEVSQGIENPTIFTLAEAYKDEAALAEHRQAPHFVLFKERTQEGFILSKSSVLAKVIDA